MRNSSRFTSCKLETQSLINLIVKVESTIIKKKTKIQKL